MKLACHLLLALVLLGCASLKSELTYTSNKAYPEYKGAVRVFYEPPADLMYDKIGIISVMGRSKHTTSQLLNEMQKDAAKYGANGIILVDSKHHYRRTQDSGNTSYSSDRYGADPISACILNPIMTYQAWNHNKATDSRELVAIAIRIQ